jgi:hypothetical protein
MHGINLRCYSSDKYEKSAKFTVVLVDEDTSSCALSISEAYEAL